MDLEPRGVLTSLTAGFGPKKSLQRVPCLAPTPASSISRSSLVSGLEQRKPSLVRTKKSAVREWLEVTPSAGSEKLLCDEEGAATDPPPSRSAPC